MAQNGFHSQVHLLINHLYKMSKIVRTWKGWTTREKAKQVLKRYDQKVQHFELKEELKL